MRAALLCSCLLLLTFPRVAHAESDVRALLKELVEIDTSNPPGNEEKAARAVAARLAAAGIPSELVPWAPGRASVVARLRATGGAGKKRPLLLLAHVDVVGAAEQPWTVPPFQLTEKDGFLYGRGVMDDKGWAALALSVFLELHRTKAPLRRDVVLALTGDEESGGAGVRYLLEHRPELLGDVELALNEGGATLTDKKGQVKLVNFQTAEKTFQDFDVVAHGVGGHSSVPNDENAIYRLARALEKLASLRFAPRLTPTVREALRGRAVLEGEPQAGALRKAAAALETIPADALAVIDANTALRALPRTTCVATLLHGGTRDNALPVEAHATVNCRLLPGTTVAEVRRTLEQAIDQPQVEVRPLPEQGMGPEVPIAGAVRDAVVKAARELYGSDAVVAAALDTGASDSRFLRARGVAAYGLGLLPITPEDARKIHGPDERTPVGSLERGRAFLRTIVRILAET